MPVSPDLVNRAVVIRTCGLFLNRKEISLGAATLDGFAAGMRAEAGTVCACRSVADVGLEMGDGHDNSIAIRC